MCSRGTRACVTVFHWAFSLLLMFTEAGLIGNVLRVEWPVLINHFPTNWPLLTRPTFILAVCHIVALIVSLIGHHKKCWIAHLLLIVTSLAITVYYPIYLKRTEPPPEDLNDPQTPEYVWFALGWLWAVTMLHTVFLISVMIVSCMWKADLLAEQRRFRTPEEPIYATPQPQQVYKNVAYVHRIYIDHSLLE